MAEDPATFERLYRTHAPGLVAFLYARLRDRAWAEDVLHDVFLAYIRRAGAEIRSPRGYLYSSAHRLSLNALRDRAAAQRARQNFAAVAPFRARDAVDPAAAAAMNDAIENLGAEEREVLVLRTYAVMTFQEIADTLEMPLTTVYTRHQHAIAALRRAMEPSRPSREPRP